MPKVKAPKIAIAYPEFITLICKNCDLAMENPNPIPGQATVIWDSRNGKFPQLVDCRYCKTKSKVPQRVQNTGLNRESIWDV